MTNDRHAADALYELERVLMLARAIHLQNISGQAPAMSQTRDLVEKLEAAHYHVSRAEAAGRIFGKEEE